MGELYLLRHAKAVPQDADTRDIDRRLDERGIEGARSMAQWFKRNQLQPDLVLCSPSVRTRETLDLVIGGFPRRPEIEFEGVLYLAGADRLMARLRDIPDAMQGVMLIGHNPGLLELAQSLTDVTNGPLATRLAANLPTAGLVRFEVPLEWSGLRRRSAHLLGMISPKELIKEN